MQPILLRTIISAAVLVAPGLALAGIALPPIMSSWNQSKRRIETMFSGGTPYNEAQLRQDMQQYITSSSMVARDVRGGPAETRDFAARFEAFASDSRSALGSVSKPAAMRESFNRMVGDCQSCHAAYNN
jgi:cytochrome c556